MNALRSLAFALVVVIGAAPAGAADLPDPFGPELGLGVGYGSFTDAAGASLGLHVGGFPVGVLYLGVHADQVPLASGGGAIAGLEVGARYAKQRGPRLTGFLSSGVLIAHRGDGARLQLGIGLRINQLLGRHFLLGATVRWAFAPEPVDHGDSGEILSVLALAVELGVAF